MKKVAIVGSRNYPKLELVDAYVRVDLDPEDIVVTGGAQGVDLTAETTARGVGMKVIVHYPEWSQGREAALARNTLIVQDADSIVAFWDGSSRGTLDTLKKAKKAGKPYKIFGPTGIQLR